jgi:FkbM family methyltransferase
MPSLVPLLNWVPAPLARAFRGNTVVARLARPLLNRVLPEHDTVVVVRDGPAVGIRLPIRPREEKFYWTGTYERSVQQALVRLLRPGNVVWDIGAHIGFFALLSARLVGPTGEVHAFEPFPDNRRRLADAVALNVGGRVVVHPEAVAAKPGSAHLHARGSSTMWSLDGSGGAAVGPAVSCTTLDDLMRRIPAPALVKIDAEGLEIDVLRGGAVLLARHRPTVLIELAREDAAALLAVAAPGYEQQRLTDVHWLLT